MPDLDVLLLLGFSFVFCSMRRYDVSQSVSISYIRKTEKPKIGRDSRIVFTLSWYDGALLELVITILESYGPRATCVCVRVSKSIPRLKDPFIITNSLIINSFRSFG